MNWRVPSKGTRKARLFLVAQAFRCKLDVGDSLTVGEGNTKPGGRQTLDDIVGRMGETDFTIRHRRVPEFPETGAHVSPEMLAMISPKSRYVKKWKRHARRCLRCANVFRYYGISLD
ncbi:MAG: hypothetical protein LJE93_10370 [Acidobacteria bacterium]|nr:hypothetical protein [Acidobacteriota bacterium]